MKQLLCISLFLFSFANGFSQKDAVLGVIEGESSSDKIVIYENQASEIYTVVEEMPSYKNGGMEGLKKYLTDSLRMPKILKENGIAGKIFVKFIVNENGSVSEEKIMRGMSECNECNEEAIRLVKAMGPWNPGKQQGKQVKVEYMLPINFKL